MLVFVLFFLISLLPKIEKRCRKSCISSFFVAGLLLISENMPFLINFVWIIFVLMKEGRFIDGPERMVEAVRAFGVLPLFKCPVEGWSVQELTAEGCWFDEDDVLGPWDWKIDCVREGDIAYGKFVGGKAAFATVGWYRHLMNWRRSIPRFSMDGSVSPFCANASVTLPGKPSDISLKQISSVALDAVKTHGSLGSKDLRRICSSALGMQIRKSMMDSALAYLQMGTWVVVGDIQRVYRGAELRYSGWQLSSNTTPELLFGGEIGKNAVADSQEHKSAKSEIPFWAKRFLSEPDQTLMVECSPEESRGRIISHVLGLFPHADETAVCRLI